MPRRKKIKRGRQKNPKLRKKLIFTSISQNCDKKKESVKRKC